MTAPGGNDEIIRVVYQAVADYSALLRETRRAREQTAALKRDIDGLAGTTTARVRVEADTAPARTALAALIRDAVIRARVVLDAAAARSELAVLVRDLIVRARIVVDAAAAKAEIRAATRDATARVRVQTDGAGLARLAAQLAQIRDLVVNVSVRADTAALAALRAQLARLRDLSVRVAATVDDTALQRLRAQLRALRDLTVRVSVDADDTALARLSAALAQIGDRRIGVDVDLDIAGIEARYTALLAHLESLGPIRLHIDIDPSIHARIAELEAELRRLRENSDNPDGPRPTPTPGGGAGGGPSDAAQKWSAAAGKVALYGSAVALAVPAAAALAVAVGTVAAALAAAGAAAGIFAVGAVGAFSKVTAAVKAYEKSGTIASGPLGAVVGKFEELKGRYKELQRATEGPIFAVFTRGLQIAIDLLDKIQPIIGDVTAAMGDALGAVGDAFNGPGFDQFLAFVDRAGPNAIRGLATGLIGFAGGLGSLLEQFEPFIDAFIRGFADAGTSFADWAANLGSNTAFQDFLNYGRENLPKIIELFHNLVIFAGHLFVALEPIGSTLLNVANAVVRLVSAIPTGWLTGILAGLLSLAVGFKAILIVNSVGGALKTFGGLLSGLPGRLGNAARAAGAMRTALIGLGASLGIGLLIAGITTAIMALGKANADAAQDAKDHADALHNFATELSASGGKVTPEIRAAHLQTLQGTEVKGQSGNIPGTDLFGSTVKSNIVDIAEQAGLSRTDVVSGNLGDTHAYGRVYGGLSRYANDQRALADAPGTSGKDATAALARADAADKAAAAYAKLSPTMAAATEDAKKSDAAIKAGTAGLDDNTKKLDDNTEHRKKQTAVYKTQAEAAAAARDALKADFASDANATLYNNAVTAMDAYTQAKKDSADAEAQLASAQVDAKRAQEDLTQARIDAAQRMKDLQRTLRDLPLDERQAKLSAKEAQARLDHVIASGGTADEVEQARIDNERAQNNLSDLQQDKGPKKAAAQAELDKGVNGNRALQDATQRLTDSKKAVDTAITQVHNAAVKVTETHLAFDTAAGAMGLTADQLDKLRTKMDALKDQTVNLVFNTHGAEAKLAALLQGQYAIQLLAADPTLSLADALTQAKANVPTVAAAAKTPAPAAPAAAPNATAPVKLPTGAGQSRDIPGHAEGGPTAVATTAGAVYGPGTGVSDSVAVRLPVGGDARLSRGEHIVTDAEVRSAPGGHGYLEAFRAGLRAGRPWGPAAPGYRAGGPATLPTQRVPAVPVFRMAALPSAVPGYAAGGAVSGYRAGDTHIDRSVTVHATITNAVPETAGESLYRQVRRAVDGDL